MKTTFNVWQGNLEDLRSALDDAKNSYIYETEYDNLYVYSLKKLSISLTSSFNLVLLNFENKKPAQKVLYRIFQDGKRCNDYKLLGWDNDTYESKNEAFIRMIAWSYPYSYKDAEVSFFQKVNKLNYLNAELGKEYDLRMGGVPIIMKVEEVYE
jgi:hypothetical protein